MYIVKGSTRRKIKERARAQGKILTEKSSEIVPEQEKEENTYASTTNMMSMLIKFTI